MMMMMMHIMIQIIKSSSMYIFLGHDRTCGTTTKGRRKPPEKEEEEECSGRYVGLGLTQRDIERLDD